MGRPPMYGVPRSGMGPLPGPGREGFPPDHFPQMAPMDFQDPLRYVVNSNGPFCIQLYNLAIY